MALTFKPYRLYGLRNSFRTKYRILDGYAYILKLRPLGWFVAQRLPLEDISTKIEATDSQKLLGRGNIKITNVSGDTMLWEDLKDIDVVQEALYNWRTLENPNESQTEQSDESNHGDVETLTATPASDDELERIRKEFKLFSPTQKSFTTAPPPRVGEDWTLERTLPSGLLIGVARKEDKWWQQSRWWDWTEKDPEASKDHRRFQYNLDESKRDNSWLVSATHETQTASWHPSDYLLATTGTHGAVKLWDTQNGELKTKSPYRRSYWYDTVCWSTSGEFFAVDDVVHEGREGNHVRKVTSTWPGADLGYRISEYEKLRVASYREPLSPQLASSNNFGPWRPYSSQYVTGDHSETISLWNASSGVIDKRIAFGIASIVTDFAWHPKGRFLAVAFEGHNILIVDVDEARIVDSLSVRFLLGWSPDGKVLIARNDVKADDFIMWDALKIGDNREKPLTDEIKDEIWYKRFFQNISADGSRYLAKDADHKVGIFSVESDEMLFTFQDPIHTAAWCPVDGGLLATCFGAETNIWRI